MGQSFPVFIGILILITVVPSVGSWIYMNPAGGLEWEVLSGG